MEKKSILGIGVTSVSVNELNRAVENLLREGVPVTILNTNIFGMNLCLKNKWLADLLNTSDIVLCDGAGVLLASRILGQPIKERIALTDWGWDLVSILEKERKSLFLLGNTPELIENVSLRLGEKFPGLPIAGAHHGFFDIRGRENRMIVEKINASGADVLLVGMGMPRQEKWVLENRQYLNAKLIVTCGALFRYFAGVQRRCPYWVSNLGLEWLYRFFHEPVRLFSRYFPGNFTFLFRVIKERLSSKFFRKEKDFT